MMSTNQIAIARTLGEEWDAVSVKLSRDAMRPIRYGKCYRYLANLDRQVRLLEVGCGEGTGLWYAQQFGFKDVTGVDVSENRLQSARERLGPTLSLRVIGTDCLLPFAQDSYDAVVSAAVIEHTINPALFVREIARVARPGGSIVISSDCWQWRILQMMRVYKSVQPIDRAMLPLRLVSILRQNKLEIRHIDGFAMPGEEYRFLRMISRSLAALASRPYRKMFRKRESSAKSDRAVQDRLTELRLFSQVATETWSHTGVIKRYLSSLCSDENVFFATKSG